MILSLLNVQQSQQIKCELLNDVSKIYKCFFLIHDMSFRRKIILIIQLILQLTSVIPMVLNYREYVLFTYKNIHDFRK